MSVLIAYQRPVGLSDDQLRSWLAGQAGPPVLLTLEPAATHDDRGVVRVTFEEPPEPGRGQDRIGGLLADMRMLGLRPAIIASR